MVKDNAQFRLFSGSSHPELTKEVAHYLGTQVGKVAIERFPDGELCVQIMENVRGQDVFVLQTTAIDPNNYLVELLIMIDALKRASAKSINVVIPYYGYGRQDRRDKPRVPITAKLVANMLTAAGATGIITMDFHTQQLEGFFDIPVDNLYGRQRLAEAARENIGHNDFVVVTPDIGSIKLAKAYASHLKVDFAIVDKHRSDATHVEVVTLIGDVKGKDVLLADDMCSTAGTLVSAAKVCQEKGAKRVFAVTTHGLLVADSVKKIEQSPIELLLISNTIPSTERTKDSKKIKTVSVANLFGQAISCIAARESISSFNVMKSESKPTISH